MKIINYKKKKKKKEMIPLTNDEKESYENQKICFICEKEFSSDKKYCKVKLEIIVIIQEKYRGAARSIAIYAIKYRERFLQYFIMDLHTITVS